MFLFGLAVGELAALIVVFIIDTKKPIEGAGVALALFGLGWVIMSAVTAFGRTDDALLSWISLTCILLGFAHVLLSKIIYKVTAQTRAG